MTEPATPPVTPPATPPVTPQVNPPVTPPVTPPATPPATPPVVTPPADDKTPYVADLGSPQLNYAVGHFVNALGLGKDSAEIQEFLKTGNDAYLRGHAAAKGLDPSAIEPFLLMANAGRKELTTAAEAKDTALKAEVHGYAGGEEQWNSMAAFVKANSTEEQMEQFDKLLSQGGLAAQAVVQLIQSKMSASPDVSTHGKDAVIPGAGAQVPQAAASFSTKAEWRAAQRALISKHGMGNYEATPEGKALMAAYHPGLR